MRIQTEYWPKPAPQRSHDWSAIDLDTYDGAEDSHPRSHCVGYGETEEEAIADLKAQLEEYDE